MLPYESLDDEGLERDGVDVRTDSMRECRAAQAHTLEFLQQLIRT